VLAAVPLTTTARWPSGAPRTASESKGFMLRPQKQPIMVEKTSDLS